MLRLLLLFTTIPLLELYLLVRIGEAIGLGPTIALILLTGVLGAALARVQGMATWARFQQALAAGRIPARELVEGLLVLVAGAVLLTPGVVTDLAGFLLLVPPARSWLVRRMEDRFRMRYEIRGASRASDSPEGTGRGEVIDAEFEVRHDDDGA